MEIETSPVCKPHNKPGDECRGLLIITPARARASASARARARLRLVWPCARGRSKAVKIFQFMKVPSARFGEHRKCGQLGISIEELGDCFRWKSQDIKPSAQLPRDGWQRAKVAVMCGEYFMAVLEVTETGAGSASASQGRSFFGDENPTKGLT